ncbi:MAG: hypothetical protein KGI06_02860 [Candidatus Micrarchaeota archaeon]|nr:hypothetical protein [Candidatus Micrarchaeota archaeon]
MFRSEPMQKVRLICLEADRKEVISALHRAGIIDLRKSKLELSDDISEHLAELSDMEIRLAGAMAILKRPRKAKKAGFRQERHLSADELVSRISGMKVIGRIYDLSEERKKKSQSVKQLEMSEGVARQISGIDIDLGSLRSSSLGFRVYSYESRKELERLKDDISNSKMSAEVIESSVKGQQSMLIAYENSIDMDDMARRYKLKPLDISLPHIKGMPKDALSAIAKEKSADEKRMLEIDRELEGIYTSDYARLAALMEMLKIEASKADVRRIFKKTERSIVIEGWVPKAKIGDLTGILSKATGGRYHMDEFEDDELAPTLMNRPKILQPFDYMINFISVPRSDELDPAIPFIISFPIFYGFMISDVGYGILSFLFANYITRITDPDGLVYNTAKIWQLSSLSAIVFGFLSNQYFGLQLNQYFIAFNGFDWFKDITVLIVVAVIFGIVQVAIGLLFGFVNKYKHHRKVAFGRLASFFLIISGTVAIAGGLFNAFGSEITLVAAGIAIASLIATMVLSGTEAAEVTNLISHPLSYARLMGFGLASVVLAFLIDKAFTPNIAMGIPVFILYFIIFMILHFMNMIVSMFEGAVQGARLNFVEFFTKFYNGGGIKFSPFSSRRVYTKE